MPRTITRTVYSYSELSQKAKDKAREWNRECMSKLGEYTDRISEQFAEDLYQHGLKSLAAKCYWSLSYCQGDGVAFYGRIDNDDFAAHDSGFKDLLARLTGLDPECSVYIMVEGSDSHYHHYNSMRVSVEHDITNTDEDQTIRDAADTIADEIREYVSQYLKDLSREFEKNGYAEIEFMDSEEYFTDACDANEWEFYADGSLVSGDGE